MRQHACEDRASDRPAGVVIGREIGGEEIDAHAAAQAECDRSKYTNIAAVAGCSAEHAKHSVHVEVVRPSFVRTGLCCQIRTSKRLDSSEQCVAPAKASRLEHDHGGTAHVV